MEWYLAKLVFRIICGNGNHSAQFDEQLRLICAEDDLHAFNKAQLLGEKEQDSFQNQTNQLVRWKFINVTELHKMEDFTDGAEMYSRIYEEENGDNYQHTIHVKARYLSENCTEQFMQSI
jgi:SLT domain-containing protein